MWRSATGLLSVILVVASVATAEDQYGSFVGEVRIKGMVAEGKSTEKPTRVGSRVVDQSFVVNSKTSGLANVFLFLKSKPALVHPDLIKSANGTAELWAIDRRLEPRALIMRTDQSLVLNQKDSLGHEFQIIPQENRESLIGAKINVGKNKFVFKVPEKSPLPCSCKSHGTEYGHVMVVDHPYFAVTNAEGIFRIEKLPLGEHELAIWHERTGFLEESTTISVRTRESRRVLEYPFERFQTK